MSCILERNGYYDLANAIVITAALDYRKAYKNCDELSLSEIKQIEKFFNSKWADLLSNGKAKEIIRRLKSEQEKPKIKVELI